MSKVSGLWKAIWNSDEGRLTKITSAFAATLATIGLLVQSAVSFLPRSMYSKDGQCTEIDTVAILIHDPSNTFQSGQKQIGTRDHKVSVVYETDDGHKLVSVPRYKPFTQLCKELATNNDVQLLQIGSQSKITVDVLHNREDNYLNSIKGAKFLYKMDKLQDDQDRFYATYEVDVSDFAGFEKTIGIEKIEHVHE